MQSPVQIKFSNMESSEAMEAAVHKRVEKLDRAFPDIMTCRVRIEAPSAKKQKGGLFQTKIEIKLPGHEIVVNRSPDLQNSHTDVYVSIRDAFKSAQRQLESHVKRIQGKVKFHEEHFESGRVDSLYPKTDSGWIESNDGRKIFFHRNSCLTVDFDNLKPGMEVSYIEHEDSEEPRASSVRPLKRE